MADSLPPVLVTDDVPEARELLLFIFARYGIPCIECPTAEETLHVCQTQPIALVITDISKPGMDGLQLLTHLRNDPLTQHIPVIILSSRVGLKSEADKALALGAERCLQKPPFPRDLVAEVKQVLAEHGIVYPSAT